MDLKTKSLGGSVVSSVYSNPALIDLEKKSSVYAEYSNLFYGLNKLESSIPGYYAPCIDKKSAAGIFPHKKYGVGLVHNQLSSPLHGEAKTSLFVSRNLNDLISVRFEESVNVAAAVNLYSIKFKEFPSQDYSNSASAFSFDFFIYAALAGNVEYGFAFKNLGNTDIGFRQKEGLPREFNFSLARKFTYFKLIFSYRDCFDVPDYALAAQYLIGGINLYSAVSSNYISISAGISIRKRLDILLGLSCPYLNDFALQPEIAVRYYFNAADISGTARQTSRQRMKEFYNRAYEAFVKKDYKEAIENWQEVLTIDPEHKLSVENIKKAKSAYKKYYFKLATQEFKSGNYGKAIEFWQKVLEMDPEHPESEKYIKLAKKKIYFTQGHQLFTRKKYKESLVWFQKVLEIEPGHAESEKYIKLAEEKNKQERMGSGEK